MVRSGLELRAILRSGKWRSDEPKGSDTGVKANQARREIPGVRLHPTAGLAQEAEIITQGQVRGRAMGMAPIPYSLEYRRLHLGNLE